MTSAASGYDQYASIFSPDGKVFQIEYAHKAVENSGTAVAVCGRDCVVFAVENIVQSRLYEARSPCSRRIFSVERHLGMAVAGLTADAHHLVERAQSEAADYRANYAQPIPCAVLADRLSLYMHAHTLYSSARPFGVSVMIGGVDKKSPSDKEKKNADEEDDASSPTGPQLFLIEPSGICRGYTGCAIGKAKQNAKTELEKLKLSELSQAALIQEAAKIIYLCHDEIKDKMFELELSWAGFQDDSLNCMRENTHQLVPKAIFDAAEQFAKRAVDEDDDD